MPIKMMALGIIPLKLKKKKIQTRKKNKQKDIELEFMFVFFLNELRNEKKKFFSTLVQRITFELNFR